MQHFKILSLLTLLASALVACGGGGSDGANPDDPPVDPQTETVYRDSFISLNYPNDWSLSTSIQGISGQILAPETTNLGGNPNCTMTSGSTPGSSITEQVDSLLLLIDDDPDPQLSFIDWFGDSAARLSGNVTLFGATLPTRSMLIYENDIDFTHAVSCFGVEQGEVTRILDSVRVN